MKSNFGDFRVWLNLGSEGLTGVGVSSNFFGSGGGLESRSLLLSFLQSELTHRLNCICRAQRWKVNPCHRRQTKRALIILCASFFIFREKCQIKFGHLPNFGCDLGCNVDVLAVNRSFPMIRHGDFNNSMCTPEILVSLEHNDCHQLCWGYATLYKCPANFLPVSLRTLELLALDGWPVCLLSSVSVGPLSSAPPCSRPCWPPSRLWGPPVPLHTVSLVLILKEKPDSWVKGGCWTFTVDYTHNTLQHKKPLGWIQNVLVTDEGPNERSTTARMQTELLQWNSFL